jgi:serine protease
VGRRFAIGLTLGVGACLAVNAVYDPQVWMLGETLVSRLFLGANALICLFLAHFGLKTEARA